MEAEQRMSCAEEMPVDPISRPQRRRRLSELWCWVAITGLAIGLWLPRLSGPIDLRWDAGVYYILGTSLATGHGYRILSEPGEPEALQYPPLLPAIVALHEKALGSTDPAVVGPWLRRSYAGLFLIYALAALALAKRFLRPIFAVAAIALSLLHFETIFLSDLLFAELPFALVSVIFALVATDSSGRRPFLREILSFALATTGFLLRTAGAVLLAAWALEALMRRRWLLAIARGGVALVPIVSWQIYVSHVRGSAEYAHPAYEYQRAPYQYYNVSYAENMRLVDPFRPELGRMNSRAYATRLAANLPNVLASLGETISTKKPEWHLIVQRTQRHLLRKSIFPNAVAMVPIFGLAAIVLAGLILLLRRSAWLMALIILGSVILVWVTPWPAQYLRYLTPLAPFLSICAFMALSQITGALRGRDSWATTMARIATGGIIVLIFGAAAYTSLRLYFHWAAPEGIVTANGNANYHLFAHDTSWQDWEETAAWTNAHAPRDAIVATSAPHLFYLKTGLRAVLPPMEPDPVRARLLLQAVPVSFVIVDNWEFLDLSRRYARPAVESDPTRWHLVQSIGGAKVYERQTDQE
jgi:hypothetical protein